MELNRPAHPRVTQLATVAEWVDAQVEGAADTSVTGISLSTQRLAPGDLYAALPGTRAHGADFAAQAAEAGAAAILTDPAGRDRALATGLPVLVVPEPRKVLGLLASRLYGEPATALTLLAVTGTQGKTTTARLLESGLAAAGVTAASIGTIGTRIAGADVRTALTTPEAPDLHALFGVMREREVECCVMEVSSHALVLGRVDGVVYDVAAFLNLGRDHLDFHRDVDDYFAAKASLFTPERARLGLTNVDDEFGRRLLEEASIPMRTFSPSGAEADWRAEGVLLSAGSSFFTVVGPGVRFQASVGLPGRFNVANALCAIALAAEGGLDPERVARGLAAAEGVPGRLEPIIVDEDQAFRAFVDYAHKPDAVEAVLQALRPVTTGRLIVVLGAGGDRDTGKRPVMGEIAARLADVLVVTDDNPRSEDPAAIRAAILAGATGPAEVIEVDGRGTAIRHAVRLARPGDTVLVAGKGHETGQEIAGVVHPFDDRDEVRAAIEELR